VLESAILVVSPVDGLLLRYNVFLNVSIRYNVFLIPY
jgi:hypothetical protein